jgi:hypothetical protein
MTVLDPATFLSGVLGGAGANSSYEPQRSNGALLYITGIGNGGIDNVVTLSLKSFPLPKYSIAPQMVGYLNEKRKYAGNPEFEDMQVTFNDYVDLGTMATLLAWWYQVYDPRTGIKGIKANYAKPGFVNEFAPDGSFERKWLLYGVWPSQLDPGEVEQGSEDLIQVSMTLTIDKSVADAGFGLAAPIVPAQT